MRHFVFLILLFPTIIMAQECEVVAASCLETGSISIDGIVLDDVCVSVEKTENCERAEPLAQCDPFQSVQASGDWPAPSGQCVEVSSECVRMQGGECDTTRSVFRCLNGPSEGGDAVMLDRVFFNLTETMEDSCSGTLPESCRFVSSSIVGGPETRNINEDLVTRSWWSRTNIYECGEAGWIDSCPEFASRPNCESVGEPSCLSYDIDGNCQYAEETYDCDGGVEYSAQCPQSICADGSCDGVPNEPNGDFGEAASWLTFLDEATKANTCDADPSLDPNEEYPELTDCATGELDFVNPQVFGGDDDWCSTNRFYNCCTGSNSRCGDHEVETGQKIRAGATHFLYSECSRTIYFGTVCVERRRHHCVYASRFARVFQEQANLQIGGRFNRYGDPVCPALTIGEMQSLDIEAMDLSEVFGDMLDNADPPVRDLVLDEIHDNLLGIGGEAADVFR